MSLFQSLNFGSSQQKQQKNVNTNSKIMKKGKPSRNLSTYFAKQSINNMDLIKQSLQVSRATPYNQHKQTQLIQPIHCKKLSKNKSMSEARLLQIKNLKFIEQSTNKKTKINKQKSVYQKQKDNFHNNQLSIKILPQLTEIHQIHQNFLIPQDLQNKIDFSAFKIVQKFMPQIKLAKNKKQVCTNDYVAFTTLLKRKLKIFLSNLSKTQIQKKVPTRKSVLKSGISQKQNQKLFLLRVLNTQIILDAQIFLSQVFQIVQKFQIVLKNQEMISMFLEKVMLSPNIQILVSKTRTEATYKPSKLLNNQIIFQVKLQYFQNKSNHEQFLNIVQKQFYNFYSQEGSQKTNKIQIKNDQIFNNYEFHLEPTNLTQYLQSYENRNHFLLDKFAQNQNIFIQEEKLNLVLKLSRDPYLPQSSAKYISHVSTLVQKILGKSLFQKQKQNKYEGLDEESRQEMKAWDDTFGSLLLKL